MKLVQVHLDGDSWYQHLLYPDVPEYAYMNDWIRIDAEFFKRYQAAETEWDEVQMQLHRKIIRRRDRRRTR